MTHASRSLPLPPDDFRANFAAIAPLILEEWAEITSEQLMATEGDLNQVVEGIATATDRTRTLIRRQLRELYQLAVLEPAPPHGPRLSERLSQLASQNLSDSDLKETIDLLEARTEALLTQFKREVLPEFNEKVRKNVGGSLLTALGIGFILGLLLGGGRGR